MIGIVRIKWSTELRDGKYFSIITAGPFDNKEGADEAGWSVGQAVATSMVMAPPAQKGRVN